MSHKIEDIEVSRIFLYEENPRHEPLETQDEVISQLCSEEQIYELASSICNDGINPMDLFGVVAKKGSGLKNTKKNYEVWEGNRRICAIQLLNDPDKAPAMWRAKFESLSSDYIPIKTIKAVVFNNHKELDFWMDITHARESGISRKKWNAEQKARRKGIGRDSTAQLLLDIAEDFKWISADERRRKLTTLTRYMSNPEMRSALGLDTRDRSSIKTDLTDEDFKQLLKIVISDLIAGKITSRHTASDHIIPYARKLPSRAKASTERVAPRPVVDVAPTPVPPSKKPTSPARRPIRPEPRSKIAVSAELEAALKDFSSNKNQILYYSVCDVSAIQHTLLVAIGAWAFVECLTAGTGREPERSFKDYFGNPFLEKLGWAGPKNKKDRGVIRDAFERLSRGGNETKHHEVAGSFDAQQIITDMEIVTPVLVAALKFPKA